MIGSRLSRHCVSHHDPLVLLVDDPLVLLVVVPLVLLVVDPLVLLAVVPLVLLAVVPLADVPLAVSLVVVAVLHGMAKL